MSQISRLFAGHVVAKKFQAIVEIGLVNSRLKDYYDVWMILNRFETPQDHLWEAIRTTFQRGQTRLSTRIPEGLSGAFAVDHQKQI